MSEREVLTEALRDLYYLSYGGPREGYTAEEICATMRLRIEKAEKETGISLAPEDAG